MDTRFSEFTEIKIEKNLPECDLLSNPALTPEEHEFTAKFFDFLEHDIHPELRKLEELNFLVEEPIQAQKADLVRTIMHKLAQKNYYSTLLDADKYPIGRVTRNALIAYALCAGRWSESLEQYIGGNWSIEMGRLAGGTLYCNPVAYKANESQKSKYLAPVVREGYMAASAMTEFEAGSDIKKMALRITPKDNNLILNGKKIFITNGMLAKYIIVYGRLPTGSLGGVIVDTQNQKLPNFHADRVRTYGMNDAFVSRLQFNNVIVPEENLLEGDGLDIAFHQLVEERLVIAAEALGDVAKKILYSHSFALQREQFDHLLAEYQIIRVPITQNIRTLALMMDSMLHYARLLDSKEATKQGKYLARLTMGLKVSATEMAFQSSIDCFRTMGGRGFIHQYTTPISFLDAYCMIHGGGSNYILQDSESRQYFKVKKGKEQ